MAGPGELDRAVVARSLERLRQLIADRLAGRSADVYLFGSHATGRARWSSDIDVAIDPKDALPVSFFSNLTEAIEDSEIPYPVDLIDLSHAAPEFRARVLRDGVKWIG